MPSWSATLKPTLVVDTGQTWPGRPVPLSSSVAPGLATKESPKATYSPLGLAFTVLPAMRAPPAVMTAAVVARIRRLMENFMVSLCGRRWCFQMLSDAVVRHPARLPGIPGSLPGRPGVRSPGLCDTASLSPRYTTVFVGWSQPLLVAVAFDSAATAEGDPGIRMRPGIRTRPANGSGPGRQPSTARNV